MWNNIEFVKYTNYRIIIACKYFLGIIAIILSCRLGKVSRTQFQTSVSRVFVYLERFSRRVLPAKKNYPPFPFRTTLSTVGIFQPITATGLTHQDYRRALSHPVINSKITSLRVGQWTMPSARGPYVPPRLWDPRQDLDRVNVQRVSSESLHRIASYRCDITTLMKNVEVAQLCI